MRFNDLLEGSKSDVSVKLFGDDMAQLAKLTHEIAAVIEKVPGAGEVETELRGTSPVLKITPKFETLRKLGIPVREVLDTVGIAICRCD